MIWFLAYGMFLLGLTFGWLLGRWFFRVVPPPAITAWGESTAQWSEADWHWYEQCGRLSDPEMVGKIRRADVDRVANLAGVDDQGSILPPPEGYSIDRRPQSWWRSSGETDA